MGLEIRISGTFLRHACRRGVAGEYRVLEHDHAFLIQDATAAIGAATASVGALLAIPEVTGVIYAGSAQGFWEMAADGSSARLLGCGGDLSDHTLSHLTGAQLSDLSPGGRHNIGERPRTGGLQNNFDRHFLELLASIL